MLKLFLFCSLAFSQTTLIPVQDILCGSPTDKYFSAGVAWTMPQGVQPAFLRYASSFAYNIPVPPGWYNVSVVLVEPNATAPRQRLFTVTVNGQVTDPVDIFGLVGKINVPYTLPLQAMAGAGYVRLQFQGIVGNAIVSEIIVTPVIVVPPAPTASILEWSTCNTPATATADCTGIEAIHIMKADGTDVLRLAVPMASAPNPPWTPVK